MLLDLLDIGALDELRGITHQSDHWRIGALTTWRELDATPLPPLFDGIKAAAREVGGHPTQNAGTIGGNLCNASPAADGVPALLALDAQIELVAAGGRPRRLGVSEFVLGSRRTARQPDELLSAIWVPTRRARVRSQFRKIGSRRFLVISIVSVAATLEVTDDGRIGRAAVAIGACSPVAQRAPGLEARLCGRPANAALGALVEPGDVAQLQPIDDIRASAVYRKQAALALMRSMLDDLAV
jgi:CO/xanthine dehydrogenase FAD-binding subunit